MRSSARPLSPHLSVYRWPITMVLSILHRATGIALSVGFVVLTAWLVAAAGSSENYERITAVLASPLGLAALVGWTAAFFLHLGSGVRHLIWDSGRGFEKSQANRGAWFVIAFAVLATAAFWWVQ